MKKIVGIRFKPAGKVYDFDCGVFVLNRGDHVIVETEQGLGFGTVVEPPALSERKQPGKLLKKVFRLATEKDFNQREKNLADEKRAHTFCLECIRKLALKMNLFSVEKSFDGSKYTFFFTAEGRVDFRQLVKMLVKELGVRIEMRQVGIRNQAKMCGGIGRCGRQLCCSTFLDKFDPVSIRMAKEQSLSLNPTKISGQCGRLMCCLTYEFETYQELKKNLPRVGKTVITPSGKGRVVRHNAICNRVAVRLEGDLEIEFTTDKVTQEKEQGEKMTDPFYVTTPIYYVNARPHLGHAYTTIVADVITRFHTMRPAEVYFLTGTDEHGDKVVRAAKKENLSPRAYVDKISRLFRDLWPQLNITNNYFIRTTDASHMEIVSQILQKIYDAGDIYFSEYEGQYCFGCERFYTDRELVDGKCPDHETAPEMIKESNYFFKMSRYQDWLLEHIKKHPDFIRPERYRNEVLAFLREPLEDLCISRPKSRLRWGITLPFDENYVTYVWFDALLNYISALGYPHGELFQKFWPVAQHIVAKDILKPHGIYWPCMLKAAGIPVYQHLNVHGYWNIEQSKMSKSLGNVVEPLELKNLYGLDAFRFFLIREMKFGLDSGFGESALVQRINSDLANDLGNLFSRIISMAHKYFKGAVPQVDPRAEQELGLDLQSGALEAIKNFETLMESFEFQKALTVVWEFIAQMNKTIDVTAPWVLAKKKSSHKQLAAVIYHLLEGLRIISGLIYPVMPDTAKKMQQHLGLDPDDSFYHLNQLRTWKALAPGTTLLKSVALFPRIEMEKAASDSAAPPQEGPPVLETKPEITIDEFSRIDLRVATVVHAEPIPKAKKLLKLEVDMGHKRTLVAGIAEKYTAEELIGKQVIIVANLKPAKLMGVVSNGMLLAAVDDSGPILATLVKAVNPGTPLK